ncbi:unnamed protein product [Brassicogethes aeneus]|uniref:Uncharacterized protein n=1 Tax=Brassicogethes aeneus TaxID=1431903 RepID=A0A9P0BJM7_BRAAE|nr:unnamed protein product [Brassicogethes aeneus]
MSKNARHYWASWKTEAPFSGWLMCAEGEPTKAFCKLCKCLLQAHKKDLLNHAKCNKQFEPTIKMLKKFKSKEHYNNNNDTEDPSPRNSRWFDFRINFIEVKITCIV